jgi:predicted transcriptional regulator
MNNSNIFDFDAVKKRMGEFDPPILQSDIASALAVTPATVNRWLSGKHKPRRRDIKAIERLLK